LYVYGKLRKDIGRILRKL